MAEPQDAHAEGEHHKHVVPVWVLASTIVALLFLTFVTVAAAQVDMGASANIIVAVLIATVKAGIVSAIFMHLWWDKPINTFILFVSLFLLGLFLSFAILDTGQYQDRIDEAYATLKMEQRRAQEAAAAPSEGGESGSEQASGMSDADRQAALERAVVHFKNALPAEATSDANPITEAKVALGQQLYFDPRLSKAQDVSCNTCHLLDNFGVDGLPVSEGHEKQTGDRNAPTVFNAALHSRQFWDGREPTVEAQAKGPLTNPVEMAMGSHDDVVEVVKSIDGYAPLFREAYPEQAEAGADALITIDTIANAIGAFERKLITPAPLDAFLDGDLQALSEAQIEGLNLFVDKQCTACHTGPLLGGNMFQRFPLYGSYPGQEAWQDVNDNERGGFKVPSLRNVTQTGPYLHDGSIGTLEEVVGIMVKHQLIPGSSITDNELASIIAFLGALEGDPTALGDLIKTPALPGDGAPRFLSTPSAVTVELASAEGTEVSFELPQVRATDPNVTVTAEPASGSVFPLGTTQVTVTARGSEQETSVRFDVVVQDTVAPTLPALSDVSAELTSGAGAEVAFELPAAQDVSGSVTVTAEPASGSTFPRGATQVTVTATDAAGNATTGTFTVSVRDTTAPTLSGLEDLVVELAGPEGTPVEFAPQGQDAAGAVQITTQPASGSVLGLGAHTVTVTGTDVAGNTAQGTFTVTVQDTTQPEFQIENPRAFGMQHVEQTSPEGTVYEFELPVATDNSGSVEVSASPAPGSTLAPGMTPVTITATDGSGNTASLSFRVNVRDTTAPTLAAVSDLTVERGAAEGAVVRFELPAARDAAGSATVTAEPASGSTFPLGRTEVTVTATDAAGNAATATFGVVVQDTTGPTLGACANVTAELTSPEGAAVTFELPAARDAGSVEVTSSPASGATFPLGPSAVTVTATDDQGNTTTAQFEVLVQDTTAPELTVPEAITVAATDESGAKVDFEVSATDLSGSAQITECVNAEGATVVSGDTYPVGETTVTVVAVDGSGNRGEASFTITVTKD